MYPLDAVYDAVEDVPEDVLTNKRYAGLSGFTIQEVSDQIKADYGKVQYYCCTTVKTPDGLETHVLSPLEGRCVAYTNLYSDTRGRLSAV